MRGAAAIAVVLAMLAVGCESQGAQESGKYCLQRDWIGQVIVAECFERQETCAGRRGDGDSCVFRKATEKPWCVDHHKVSSRCYLTEEICERETGRGCRQRWTPKMIGVPD